MNLFVLIVLSVLFAVNCLDDEDLAARIFVYKSTYPEIVVEGKPFVVTYKIINNGDATATKIDLMDRYDPNSFDLIENVSPEGTVVISIDELGPDSESVYNVTVAPKLYGMYESTRARVRYNTGMHIDEVEDDVRSGYSTSLGRVKILSTAEHLQATSYFVKEWAVFLLLCILVTVGPYMKWVQARAEYSEVINGHKK